MPPPRPKKTQQRKKKVKPPLEKSAYEMTLEELSVAVQKEVDDHFKPKKPEPKEPVDPVAKKILSLHDVPTKAERTHVGL